MNLITIQNDGQKILETNYFSSSLANAGLFYCSINAGAIRLLIPSKQAAIIQDAFKTTRSFEIERGLPTYPGVKGITIFFVDGTPNPFCLQLDSKSLDRLPTPSDYGRTVPITFWTEQAGKLQVIKEDKVTLIKGGK